jgi:UDP:flavonoid glycosyltransferase YjiC (YdhE family)
MNISRPSILFFNVNGSGMGHLNRCLAYARRLKERARPCFFSLASAIEHIEEMGFAADYFVSHYWSESSTFAWNSELAVRFGLMLERIRPAVLVFDGTWPFQGFMAACAASGISPALVWSNRGLLKADIAPASVDENAFDLVICPGELGDFQCASKLSGAGRRIVVPPVCLLESEELMTREAARASLGLDPGERFVLFSLGPGNLKDVTGIGLGLIRAFEAEGFRIAWACAPISVRDVALPPGVIPLSVYPLARYLRAFDAIVGAAGYNTCCEVVQAGIPALLVPNEHLADDQRRRALKVAQVAPVVVSVCETEDERSAALSGLLKIMAAGRGNAPSIPMNGAMLGAEAIMALAAGRV